MKTLLTAVVLSGLVLGMVSPVSAGSVAAKKPSAIRTVSTDSGTECLATAGTYAVTRLMNPDGTVGAFSIPAGQVFVVTAVELRGNGGVLRANRDAQLSLFRESNSGAAVSEGIVEYGTLDAEGLLSTWRTGTYMVVKSGARLCARADDLTNGQTFLALAVVHGFLAIDR